MMSRIAQKMEQWCRVAPAWGTILVRLIWRIWRGDI